jgi:hypothetical protein
MKKLFITAAIAIFSMASAHALRCRLTSMLFGILQLKRALSSTQSRYLQQ